MKDAFERRALLLHLGDVLNVINAALADIGRQRTLQQVIAANGALAGQAWLASLGTDMDAQAFVKSASAAFAAWPAQLLEERVDYAQLAAAVQRNLFADNAAGWRAYVDVMKAEVAWFGDTLVPPQAHAEHEASTAGSEDAGDPAAPGVTDIERGEANGQPQRESVEGSDRLYPTWPWKPGI
jgi:hypothetical protein